jgi:D-alanyl-lipoteichoic acid acyltransferase DltB (MBOAT superfamily)
MLFQSQVYVLAFLPVTVALYYAAAGSATLRQWVLIAASLFFYGWWDPRFIILVVSQITATWLLALAYERTKQRAWLVTGVILNLASLGTFKYLDFLLASFEAASGVALPRAHLILPIGISFFSFQLISYLVDRMRGDAPLYPFRPFALFVLVFPHVIAGPIVRHNELVPQFALSPLRDGLWMRIGTGLVIFTVGFGKKVLLADRLAPVVDQLFNHATQRVLDFGEAWTAALAFSFQLFLDFSAYTEMAIGTALLFGLLLPENFRRPYLSTSLRDFWRRWHISLSNFLRDYLYIPLGGSRAGAARFVFATIVTMGLCGLWHGAGWTYVVWGLWHGVGLVVCRGWQKLGRPMPELAGWALTMLFVLAGWVVFRASSFSTAGSVLASLAGLHGFAGAFAEAKLIALAALASAVIPSAYEMKDHLTRPRPVLAVVTALLAAFCVFEVGKGAPVNFIYFQF